MRQLPIWLLAGLACYCQTREERVAKAAEALRDKVVEQRRDFHRHPELSNREERTARVVAEKLRALGFDDVKTGVGKHGIVALLKGGKPGPVVAWRADMDALPVFSAIDKPFKSMNNGVHHACGHDAHMAIALAAAEVLLAMVAERLGEARRAVLAVVPRVGLLVEVAVRAMVPSPAVAPARSSAWALSRRRPTCSPSSKVSMPMICPRAM